MAAHADNFVSLTGRLGDDPDLRFTPGGHAVCEIRMAVNSRRFNKDTNQHEDVLDGWYTVQVWRDAAEHVAQSLRKGDRVTVHGKLKQRSYENREGKTVWITEIEADEVAPSLRWATATVERNPSGGNAHTRQQVAPAAPEPDDASVPF
jgi:single-strand DNA-binding protein